MSDEMTDDEFRQRVRIESDLHNQLSQCVWDNSSTYIGGQEFHPLDPEECEELGYSEDDSAILLRRESDGAVFEIEIDVTAHKLAPARSAA